MDEMAQRAAIAALMAEHGESHASMSRLLGRNPAYFQQYMRRGSPRLLPERDRALLARYFGVAEETLGGPAAVGMTPIPRLDVDAAAGPGGLAEGDLRQRPAALDPALLRRLGVRASAASMIRVLGDSMEPLLSDGDEILVDRDRRTPSARAGLFVLRIEETLKVKQLRAIGCDVEIASANPAHGGPRIVPGGAIDVIGRVVWLSRALI
ncbi:S24 family peptidase [Stakelama tenebrarum]|uniref:Helix-turn-helix transcriptional regulator n=1 Tax=Stakelama tenebrarum TaxID=2711215 RepID=A0A6G6Y8G9_9SPHN|nr:helix-turn-helix transcriptional regulator [Sphingosinithalassobacter tenebrarum]QIG81097.1 helix-turn-helix transcriptional regulator [Sphingosinithalassobacter tenebrarum]